MKTLDANLLFDACGDHAREGGITIQAELEPLGGQGAPVKPPIYAGGFYQIERRWWGNGDERRPVDAIVVDNVPSQANRLAAWGLRRAPSQPQQARVTASGGTPVGDVFYVEVEAPAGEPAMVEALSEVSEHATFTRLLGTYASGMHRR